VVVAEALANWDGVGEPVRVAVAHPESEALTLSVTHPEELPLVEYETELVLEELKDGDRVLDTLRHALAVKEGERLTHTEAVTEIVGDELPENVTV
jgi:hypothetical protein